MLFLEDLCSKSDFLFPLTVFCAVCSATVFLFLFFWVSLFWRTSHFVSLVPCSHEKGGSLPLYR